MQNQQTAKKLEIRGVVQGVGFRPFVYQLAKQLHLTGEVANTSSGVSVHLEGAAGHIDTFCADLVRKKPRLAHITEFSACSQSIRGFENFSIVKSRDYADRSALISPDVSVCEDCLDELFNPKDRRYRYPFINCTNCGPRYSIISDIPYDRPTTSMKHFEMCGKCQAEYDDPGNRRFHAQPNACDKCGPRVGFCDNDRTEQKVGNPVEKAVSLLKQGYILAVKGLGGFHLVADAENDDAVIQLRKRKHREEKPFALMSRDMESIAKYAHIDPEDESLLLSAQRPIVLLRKKEGYSIFISAAVSPRNRYFGVMLPYTPLHYLLFSGSPKSGEFAALVMTSANMSSEPIVIDNEEAFERLSGIADYFLLHNRDIYLRSDDSIVRSSGFETRSLKPGFTQFIRRSRGYVPMPIFLKNKMPPVLACGAELKNTVCLTKENQAFLSQHIGDMENLDTYAFFEKTVDHMRRILDICPEIIAHDLHPDYLSTRYAKENSGSKIRIPVQHHHAHVVSCMAEHMLEGPVIGLSFDGTGYGTDGNIWGGEILIAETDRFTRAAHLSYVPMPGGTAAIKEPWRMALSYLWHTFGEAFRNLDLPMLGETEDHKLTIIPEMIRKEINSPKTSSLGRLFDAIACIAGIRNQVFFEGQATMELEMMAGKRILSEETYDYEWIAGEVHEILPQPLITGVVEDMRKDVSLSEISGKFHMTLVRMFSALCHLIRKERGLNRVVLSGGVFQNALLLGELTVSLEKSGFQVFTNTRVPPNDGGISLGQAVVGASLAGK
ncbi:MAG: carbamoyltransferase HypF [Desulfobacteraceae bacterium 4572_88]|nr:MAG: carbamoyltransferase HypF [Desulfobacteraceae bacterium 4572_88]